MKRYNIKVKLKNEWIEYDNCYFIDDLESYKNYEHELNNKFLISELEIKNLKTFIGHGHSFLTGVSGLFCGMISEKEGREPMIAHLKLLQATILCNQIKSLLKGEKLIINENNGYFTIKPNQEYKILNIHADKFTKKDIRIIKWWGGTHYYAKIGNIDVVDDDGNVKWNTEQYAYDIAIKYMNKLNNS